MTADISWTGFLRIPWGSMSNMFPFVLKLNAAIGVPRKSMRLEGNPDYPKLIITETRQDVTERMINWAQKRVIQMEKENLRGFIFKSNSPSCEIGKVKIYNEKNVPHDAGVGIFAGIFIKRFLSMPVADAVCLNDSGEREKFMGKVFAYAKQHAK
jgi:uncharacterized protein YbbK (DUF523 family)